MSSAATVYQTLNLIAITCAALAGSTAARRRGLDPVGVLCCACITAWPAACSVTSCCRTGSPPASPIPGTPPPRSRRAPFCVSPLHTGQPGASWPR